MSVLIKDYDKPKHCVECVAWFANVCLLRDHTKCPLDGVPDWCPMDEVTSDDICLNDGSNTDQCIQCVGSDEIEAELLGRLQDLTDESQTCSVRESEGDWICTSCHLRDECPWK